MYLVCIVKAQLQWALVGVCAVVEHLIVYYNNLSPLDEVLSTFSIPGYCVANISPGSW